MARNRRRFSPFACLGSLESLGPRISPSALSLGVVAEVWTIRHPEHFTEASCDDPPITQPALGPNGPSGPGSSS